MEFTMYSRIISALCLAFTLICSGSSFSSVQASTRHHYHRHQIYHHFTYAPAHQRAAAVAQHPRFVTHLGRTRLSHFHRWQHEDSHAVNVTGIEGTLAAKAHEIVASCGSTIISGFRPGARIAGSGHVSMHASGRAVDIKGNPGCIYSHLHGWPGGYSVDYGSVQHVHVSLGGFEDGVRFSHHGSGHRHGRYS
jgi:hypothetical protein